MTRRIVLLLALVLTACNLPRETTNPLQTQPGPDSTSSASASPTPIPIETLLALPTATFASLPTPTPRRTLASAAQPVNCRYGPGVAYAVVGGLEVGAQADVLGKSADEQWWNVRNPNDPSTLCWLAAGVVTITGNADLPVVAIPPTLVTRVEVSVAPASLNVACDAFPQYFTVSAELFVNGPASVNWQWETSEGEVIPGDALQFYESGSQVVRVYYTVNAARDYWLQLHVLAPNDLADRGFFKVTCVP